MFFCGDAEGECALVVGVCEAEIAEANDIHADDDIIVLEIAFHHFTIGHHIASRYQDMDQVCVGAARPANARDSPLLVRFKLKLLYDARGNDRGRGTRVPHGIFGVKRTAGQRIYVALGLQCLN